MFSAEISACKSPKKMQKHLENLPPIPFDQQLIKASEWVKDSLCFDEKILCIGQEIPAKLQDGPQCGIVSLWMAGQHLDPENDWEVSDIQEKATALNYTKHGEMFSANNMAKLAKKVFDCQAEKVKGSHEILTKLPKLLDLLINERKLILVPYDSDADQWPCLRKGHKAHWGLIFGLALIMPYKNKVFYEAKHLDPFVSFVEPEKLNQDKIELILEDAKEIKYLLMLRQSKSKRIFLFNPRILSESNNNLTGYSTSHRHQQLFFEEGFVMPPGGVKSGLKGQLVLLCKAPEATEDDDSV